jgi:hypothetical protein
MLLCDTDILYFQIIVYNNKNVDNFMIIPKFKIQS